MYSSLPNCSVSCRYDVISAKNCTIPDTGVSPGILQFFAESFQKLAGARKNSAKSCRIPGKTPVSGIVQFFAESGKSSTISGVIFGKKMYKSRQRCYIWKRTVFCRKCKLIYDFAILAATKLHPVTPQCTPFHHLEPPYTHVSNKVVLCKLV